MSREHGINLDLSGAVATLTLTRAHKRNALRLVDWNAFAGALHDASTYGAKALVVTSADPSAFCAGSDLAEIASLATAYEKRAPFAQAMGAVMDWLANGPMVTIACITGHCHGAGVAIATACDIRLASPQAVFSVPPARYGISYPIGDIQRLQALIGRGQTARLLYSATAIDANEAARIKLVEAISDDAWRDTQMLAQAIANNSSDSIEMFKRALANDLGDPVSDRQFLEGFASADFRRFVEHGTVNSKG